MKYDNRYIVKLLRLLVQRPSGANVDQFLELCRSSALEARIGSVDLALLSQIKSMRKAKKSLNAAHQATTSPSPLEPNTTPSSELSAPGPSEASSPSASP
jgi:hypothetical protein